MGKLQKLIDDKAKSAQFMCDEITRICKDLPKRDPGSEGEKLACEYIADYAKRECGAERADIESFTEHPNAFFGFLYFTVTFGLFGIGLFFRLPILGAIFLALGLLLLVFQFGFYKKVIDVFFPKKTGHNVTILKKCTGEVKGRVFFNGHVDAVWQWPFHHKFGSQVHTAIQGISIIGALIWLVLDIIAAAKTGCQPILGSVIRAYGEPLAITGFVCLIFAPILALLYFMWDERTIVDGANDNLSGCYMGMAILKALKDNDIDLEHTEVGVIIAGSEEAGLRGAMAWSKAHKGEFDDVPTWIYSFDTITESKYLGVNYRDLNGTVPSDREVSDSFMEAANQLGIKCSKTWVPPLGGATDNAAFNKAGFRSTGITAMNHVLQSYYHTVNDTPENLCPECLADCYAVAVKCLENFDAKFGGADAE